jgi:hypothetical protein
LLAAGTGCFSVALMDSTVDDSTGASTVSSTPSPAPSPLPQVLAGYPTILGTGADDLDGSTVTRIGSFRSAWGVISDEAAGVLYIGDSSTIRRYTFSNGNLETLAGKHFATGYVNATGENARLFSSSSGLLKVGSALYWTENGDPAAGFTMGNCAIRKLDLATRAVTTLAGPTPSDPAQSCGFADGPSTGARFRFRNTGQLLASDGTYLYVADSDNHAIRRVALDDGTTTTIAGGAPPTPVPASGSGATATGNAASFWFPYSVFYSPLSSALFVGDGCNGMIRRIDLPGLVVTQLTGNLSGASNIIDGIGTAARHYNCSMRGGVIDPATDRIYVPDGNALREFDPGTNTVTTRVGTLVGTSGAVDGPGATARIFGDNGAYALVGDYVYFVSSNALRRMHRTTYDVDSVLGNIPSATTPVDGAGTDARFGGIQGLVPDPAGGGFYVFDGTPGRTLRRLDSSSWTVTTLAGVFPAVATGYGDGVGAAARLGSIRPGVFVNGLLYFADATYCSIRTYDPATGTVSTIAGMAPPTVTGNCATTDGAGTDARFNLPQEVVHLNGSLYVTESAGRVVRKITLPSLAVSTLAGLGGSSGFQDGQGSAARFGLPFGMVAGQDGMLYVADFGNFSIRRVDPSTGDVLTVAGAPPPTATAGLLDGAGTAARLLGPARMYVEPTNGTIFFTDAQGPAFRSFDPATGAVTTRISGPAAVAGVAARFSPGKALLATGSSVFLVDL